ncbi:MAG: FISUMP domain-containing protein [Bacteroidales bacterium]|jgi:uncharacterized protein (TIGR02145 family)|nr:FISUMP domain-containing protein [Bacteroidales bacterium]
MSKTIIFLAFFIVTVPGLFSQQPAIKLTFNAEYNGAYTQLDSVRVINRSAWSNDLIRWPDTSLYIEINPGDLLLCVGYATSTTGVKDLPGEMASFELFQNRPNPAGEWSEISMNIPGKGLVNSVITDAQGKIVVRSDRQLGPGLHSFRFFPGKSYFYVYTACWNGITRSIKIISSGMNEMERCRLDYLGASPGEAVLKNSLQLNNFVIRQSGILDTPEEDTTYTFRFATRIPCPGMPVVEYEGQVYNTIQIFSQCWLKENLNVGVMVPGEMIQLDNGIIEKYCYLNQPDSCIKYGGLYQWREAMHYAPTNGARGICPPGWHVPTDEEWLVLEGAVDGQYGIGSYIWDYDGSRGYDAGTNLKTTDGWYDHGNGLDLFSFSALPGGSRPMADYFHDASKSGFWWTSTEAGLSQVWYHYIYGWQPVIYRDRMNWEYGYSVRCLRDF